MRERFTEWEWNNAVLPVWMDAVGKIAQEDTKGFETEKAHLVEELILGRTSNPDPLFREVAAHAWSVFREKGIFEWTDQPTVSPGATFVGYDPLRRPGTPVPLRTLAPNLGIADDDLADALTQLGINASDEAEGDRTVSEEAAERVKQYILERERRTRENPRDEAKRILRAKLSPEEYTSYVTAVLFHAVAIAKAAGEPGREVSADEATSLSEFARDWDIDLAPLWQKMSDWRS
jgi:hypothetical protein